MSISNNESWSSPTSCYENAHCYSREALDAFADDLIDKKVQEDNLTYISYTKYMPKVAEFAKLSNGYLSQAIQGAEFIGHSADAAISFFHLKNINEQADKKAEVFKKSSKGLDLSRKLFKTASVVSNATPFGSLVNFCYVASSPFMGEDAIDGGKKVYHANKLSESIKSSLSNPLTHSDSKKITQLFIKLKTNDAGNVTWKYNDRNFALLFESLDFESFKKFLSLADKVEKGERLGAPELKEFRAIASKLADSLKLDPIKVATAVGTPLSSAYTVGSILTSQIVTAGIASQVGLSILAGSAAIATVSYAAAYFKG